jgi:hypothetical protein
MLDSFMKVARWVGECGEKGLVDDLISSSFSWGSGSGGRHETFDLHTTVFHDACFE